MTTRCFFRVSQPVALPTVSYVDWVVTDPEARFDASNLDHISLIGWVLKDEPFRTFPVETFMTQLLHPSIENQLAGTPGWSALRSLGKTAEFPSN
jgi:hypothetical protein